MLLQSTTAFLSAHIMLLLFIIAYPNYVLCLNTPSPSLMVLDLHLTTSTFIAQANKWSVSGLLTSNTYSKCSNTYLLGGYNILDISSMLTMTYDNLALHTSVFITISLWCIDAWTYYNYLYISVANPSQQFTSQEMAYLTYDANVWSSNVCGDSNTKDLTDVTLNIQTSHTGILVLQIHQENNGPTSNRGQLGLRNVQIVVSNTTVSSPVTCMQTQPAGLFQSGRSCACPKGTYQASDLSCQTCDQTCQTCFDGTPKGCLSCPPTYSFDGTNCIPCASTCETCSGTSATECLTCPQGSLLSSDHSCVSACPSPLVPLQTGIYSYCACSNTDYSLYANNTCNSVCPSPGFTLQEQFPVNLCNFQCDMSDYLYQDGSCDSTCETYYIPINEGGFKYCYYPCHSGNYLYWDGSCVSDCPSPLTITQKRGQNYCTYTCGTTQYLTYNKTCQTACDFPYIIQITHTRNLCLLPCASNQYLWNNGSCLTSCNSPMIKTWTKDVPTCQRPCPDSAIFYYPEDGSCKSTCIQPYVYSPDDISMSCSLNLSASDTQQVQAIASVTSAATTTTQSLTTVSVLASADPSGISAAMLTKMIQYIRYMNITFSAKLEMSFKVKNATSGFIPFVPSMGTDLRSNFVDYPVPKRFAIFNVFSSFLVNFWEGYMSLVILCGAWLGFRLIEIVAGVMTINNLSSIFFKIRANVQNFLITQFYGCLCDIVMFSAIEFRFGKLNSHATRASFSLAICSLVVIVLAFFWHFRLLFKYSQINNTSTSKRSRARQSFQKKAQEKFNKEYEGLKVLFFHFKDTSFLGQCAFLFLSIKTMLNTLILATLYDHPLLQAGLILIFNIMMIFYLIIKRPYKSVVSLAQQITGEIILLIANSCVFGMGMIDNSGISQVDLRDRYGQGVIYCSTALSFLAPIFMVPKLIEVGWAYYKLRKAKVVEKQKPRSQIPNINIVRVERVDNPQRFEEEKQIEEKPNLQVKGKIIRYKLDKAKVNNSPHGQGLMNVLKTAKVARRIKIKHEHDIPPISNRQQFDDVN